MHGAAEGQVRRRYDAAVVGLGPVGATLANLLCLSGLRVLVLEREAQVFPLPRAIQFDGECMRVFQAVGIAGQLVQEVGVIPGMRFLGADGRLLIDWQRPTQRGPQGWHASYRFHQPALESALRARLAARPQAAVCLRHALRTLEQQEDGVLLHVEDLDAGTMQQALASYVIGCDGARSSVRRHMATVLNDLQSHQRWLVVDVILHEDLPGLGQHSVQYCEPARPATYVRGVGLRRRWELMLLPGEDAEEMARPEKVWQLLSRWIKPCQGVLERPAAYTFHAVLAQGWRDGRLLLAGDAAHQTPPFMGQGMCAGIRDAANLAWKLASVVRGEAPPALLDSYETERAPHVQAFIEAAVRLGGIIQSTDPAVAAQRDADLAARPERFTTPQPPLGPGIHDGGALGGRLGEQPAVGGALLDELAGYGYCLLAHPALAAGWSGRARCAVVAADGGPAQGWLERMGVGAVLLRPDRYIAGGAGDAPALALLLQRYGLDPAAADRS